MPETRMNSLKSLAMNCGPLSEMIRGRASGCSSLARSQYDLDFRLGHRLPQIPGHDLATTAVQNAAQIVERPADGHRTADILHSFERKQASLPFSLFPLSV